MVKNTTGGNKGKSFARKNISSTSNNAKLRYSEDEDELYAVVSRMLGNGMCHVNCISGGSIKTCLCIIRNKFRGRSKRDNTVAIGTYVLVGLRSWETAKSSAIEKCDLVEIYSDFDKNRLMKSIDKPWHLLKLEHKKIEEDDNIEFSNNEKNESLEQEIQNMQESSDTHFGIEDEIDIDDI
jgi:translation initiation factor IF-1